MSFFPPADKMLNKDYVEGYVYAWKECRKEQWKLFGILLATAGNVWMVVHLYLHHGSF
jgi:hypothetical protein